MQRSRGARADIGAFYTALPLVTLQSCTSVSQLFEEHYFFKKNLFHGQGVAIGNGVYFAVGSAYSIQGYCPADATGQKYIYQARVLTGKMAQGAGGMKEPPALPGRTDATYDSVTNAATGSAGSMFVVFFDAQTYPEYLITFR